MPSETFFHAEVEEYLFKTCLDRPATDLHGHPLTMDIVENAIGHHTKYYGKQACYILLMQIYSAGKHI